MVWIGVEPLGERDGRVALYLTDHVKALAPPHAAGAEAGLVDREARIVTWLTRHGASFFGPLHEAAGGGFPQETVDALWSLVWKGLVTNDTLHPLRTYAATPEKARRPSRATPFRSRRLVPPSADGRWTLVGVIDRPTPTAWATAMTEQLLTRHGVVSREVTTVDPLPGGFSAVYPVLRRLEETGRVRRGYFVAGLGGAQFAQPGAVDLLRAERDVRDEPQVATLAATDPASPYGALVPWPAWPGAESLRASRSAGARVVLVDGYLAAWLARGNRQMLMALPPEEPERSRVGRALARELVRVAHDAPDDRRGWLLAEINGMPAHTSQVADYLLESGFAATSGGLQLRVPRRPPSGPPGPPDEGVPEA